MEMFSNPNISSWVVERLPCAFAKPNPDGSMGTHFAMVLLDKNRSVLHITSECEITNGDGVQLMHELGDGNDTCFASTAAFRKALSTIHAASTVVGRNRLSRGTVRNDVPTPVHPLPPMLANVFHAVWVAASEKHNGRSVDNAVAILDAYKPNSKVEYLNRVLNTVVYNILGLHPAVFHGRHQERVHKSSLVKNELKYLPIFQISEMNFDESTIGHTPINGVTITEPGVKLVMHIAIRDYKFYENIFAIRDVAKPGAWVFDKDNLMSFAGQNYTVFSRETNNALGKALLDQRSKEHKFCIFCNDVFERMERHISGAKHIDRVVEVAKLSCQATSRMGLKMLNNPRHRDVFLKRH